MARERERKETRVKKVRKKKKLGRKRKKQLDATYTDVYSQLVNSQHVSGIIMPIVRRTR